MRPGHLRDDLKVVPYVLKVVPYVLKVVPYVLKVVPYVLKVVPYVLKVVPYVRRTPCVSDVGILTECPISPTDCAPSIARRRCSCFPTPGTPPAPG